MFLSWGNFAPNQRLAVYGDISDCHSCVCVGCTRVHTCIPVSCIERAVARVLLLSVLQCADAAHQSDLPQCQLVSILRDPGLHLAFQLS